MDSACASGEDSAILTHRQMDFIEVLIKKKGGQVPTFEDIFGVQEYIGQDEYICYQTVQSYQQDPSRFNDKTLSQMFQSSTTIYKHPQLHDQKLCSFCGSSCNLAFAQKVINVAHKEDLMGLNV